MVRDPLAAKDLTPIEERLTGHLIRTSPVGRVAEAGVWGISAFENDDAFDWLLNELASANDRSLRRPMEEVVAASASDLNSERRALVCAEVVAASLGRPGRTLPPEVMDWVDSRPAPFPVETVATAHRVVVEVARNSATKELWRRSKRVEEWSAAMAALARRLNAPPPSPASPGKRLPTA